MAKLSPALRAVALGSNLLDRVAPQFTTEIMLHHFLRPRRKAGRDYRHRMPRGAQRLNISHGPLELTAWAWGDSGPAVLLVHGWEDHAGSMLNFVEPLLSRGYRVCVLDMPGHGLSPKAATHVLDTSLALENTIAFLGPFHSIIAHSFGAAATCLMLERSPSATPQRLALISPMHGLGQHLQVFADIALLSPEREARLRRRLEQLIGTAVDEVCALRAARSVAVDTLVIHDRHDPVIPHETGVALARTLPRARFVSTSSRGHRRVLTCQNVLREILDYHGDCR